MSEDVEITEAEPSIVVPCNRCGRLIRLPTSEIVAAGGLGSVSHATCPGERVVPEHEYRIDVTVWRDGEKIAATGAGTKARMVEAALPVLADTLSQNWARMASLASLGEIDLIAEEQARIEAEVKAEAERQAAHPSPEETTP